VIHVGMTALLVVLWILAWGQVTVANVLSGLVVAAALLLAFPQRRGDRSAIRLSAAGIARLAAYVVIQLIESNIVMTRQILRRDTARRPGVLAHRLERPSAQVATVMSSVIALSPGTMTIDVAGDSSVVYVHFFELDEVGAARASLVRLEQLVTNAIAARSRSGRSVDNDKEPP
jgi:multicomponent Na+:H+ antiporter subunit E